MYRRIHLLLLVCSPVAFAAGPCFAQDQDEFGRKLGAVEALQRGTQTPLALVQSQCDALLQEYTAPEQQGRIYYQLVKSYGQARMSVNGHAAKVIEYAQKALKCPLDPHLRLRLYGSWGAAIMLSDVTRPIPQCRAAAAAVYLRGLKEAKQYNIPDVPPERPGAFFLKPGMDEETFKRERQAHFKEVRRVDYVRSLYEDRVVLERQLLFYYSRKPRAPDELRKLATEVFGAGPDAEKLMDALAAKCERVDKRLEP